MHSSKRSRASESRPGEESSVLFSLKELMGLEDERMQSEALARENLERAVRASALEKERAAHEAVMQKGRAELEQLKQAERQEREEAARLEAIHFSEIERVRLAVIHEAQLATQKAEHAHTLQLKQIQQDKKKTQLTVMLVASGVAAVALMIGGGFAIQSFMQRSDRALQAIQQEKEAAQKAAAEQKRDLETSEAKRKRLEEEAAIARQSPTPSAVAPVKPPVYVGPVKPLAPAKAPPPCRRFDPLCPE
jgi:colicin import membrane protein